MVDASYLADEFKVSAVLLRRTGGKNDTVYVVFDPEQPSRAVRGFAARK